MSFRRPSSLKKLIFRHEIAFLLLVSVTGAIGFITSYFWKYNSSESVRINSMFYITEQIRSNLYAQTQEMIRARLLEDKQAFRIYSQYSRSISEKFNLLRQYSKTHSESVAIQALNLSYREIQQDMNNLFNNPYVPNSLARIQFLNPEFATSMLVKFETRHFEFKKILSIKNEELNKSMQNWTKIAPFIIPIPFFIAIIIVLYSRYVMRVFFVRPIENIIHGFKKISQGELNYLVKDKGVAEIKVLVTTINKMAKDLKDKNKELIEKEKQAALGSLVPVVAHNVRNPLASIRATSQLLTNAENKKEIYEYRDEIIKTTDRLERWISSLVFYLHPLEPHLVDTKPTELINTALGLLQDKIRRKKIKIVKEDWKDDVFLKSDPDLMEQALYGLLNNAVEALTVNGCIIISFKYFAKSIEINIADNGPGLPFKPKSGELEPGSSTKRFGTGLGIPFAFKICQKHNWDLIFNTDKNKGAEVVIIAPFNLDKKDIY